MTKLTGNMSSIYRNNKGIRKGRDKGHYTLYHIFCPGKHRGIHQGYIGVSKLSLEGVKQRYENELLEAFDPCSARKTRHVHKMMSRFGWELAELASGLTEEVAYQLEESLRPTWNYGGKDIYNWNIKKGGK